MQNTRQKFGEQGESLAVWYLKKNGYKILEQNYRTKLGEIDIIAKEKKTLVFVEVKIKKINTVRKSEMGGYAKKTTQNFNGCPFLS